MPLQPGADGTLSNAAVATAADLATSAPNADATVTFAAVPGLRHYLGGVIWSYHSGTPTGTIQVLDNGVVVREWAVTQSGPGGMEFAQPLVSAAAGTALVLKALAGGANVI